MNPYMVLLLLGVANFVHLMLSCAFTGTLRTRRWTKELHIGCASSGLQDDLKMCEPGQTHVVSSGHGWYYALLCTLWC